MIKDLFGTNYISKEDVIDCFQELIDEYEDVRIETSYKCYFPKKQAIFTLDNNLGLHPDKRKLDLKTICLYKNPFIVSYYEVTISYNLSKRVWKHPDYILGKSTQKPQALIGKVKREILNDINEKVNFCLVRLFNVRSECKINDYLYTIKLTSDITPVSSHTLSKYSNLVIEK